MNEDELRAEVDSRGGNPECLHCRVGVLLSLHLETLEARPRPSELAAALVEIAGELAALAPEHEVKAGLGVLADLLGARCAQALRRREAGTRSLLN